MSTFTWETREQWGAAAPRARRSDTSPRGVAIHYPGPGDYPSGRYVMEEHRHCQSLMRRWQEMHKARGSNDVEYGLVLCQHLRLMEARVEKDKPWVRVGSNGTAAANTTHSSIQLMRGTLDPAPTDEEIRALGEAVAWLREHGGWGPSVTGHRDHYATACPGDALYRRLPDIRRIADEGPDDMPTLDEIKDAVRDAVREEVAKVPAATWRIRVGEDLSGQERSAGWHLTSARNLSAAVAFGDDPEPDPDPEPCSGHRVVKGDSLSKIAIDNGVTVTQLLEANPDIIDPNRIEVGDCIAIPKG